MPDLPPLDAELADSLLRRVWSRDATLWGGQAGEQMPTDWLDSPHHSHMGLADLQAWADDIHRRLRPKKLLLIGQGGATLGAQVLVHLAPDPALEFQAIESLNAAVLQPLEAAGLADTLIVIASKSGDTLETVDLAKYCASLPGARQSHVIFITDPNTPMHEDARTKNLALRLNWPGIGGRYSALSEFGLAVCALLKLPLEALLENAKTYAEACGYPADDNPGVQLGEKLYACWNTQPCHLYFDLGTPFERFGLWVEQLIAESSGKSGKGILPVRHSPPPDDAPIMRINWRDPENQATRQNWSVSEWAGIGGELYRWEFAMAWAAARRGANPFDQPDVAATKQHTRERLAGAKPLALPSINHPPLTISTAQKTGKNPAELLADFCANVPGEGYLAILAHLPQLPPIQAGLDTLINALIPKTAGPVTLGFAPQYLHATGQLHKGGPATGSFLQLIPADEPKIPIPGRSYTFADLLLAQADADWQRLSELGRPLLRVTLHGDPAQSLPALTALAGVH